MSNYYSDDPEVEARLIKELGVPDLEYEKALKKALTINPNNATTEELWEIVKHLEPEGYFDGRKTRDFFIAFINWQKDRNRDAGYFTSEDAEIKEI